MCNLLTKKCSNCKAKKLVIFFPLYYKNYDRFGAEYTISYLSECHACGYKRSDERMEDDNTLHNPSRAKLYLDTGRAKKHGIVQLEALCELCGKLTEKPAEKTHHPMNASPYLTVSVCDECDKKIHRHKTHRRKHKKRGERKPVKRSDNRTSTLKSWGYGPQYTFPEVKKLYWDYYAEVINFLSQPNTPEFDMYKNMFNIAPKKLV
jgi:hypothetical protein